MRERTDDERDSAAEEFYREPVERLARETAERLKPWTLEQRIAQWREQSQLSQRDAEMARRVDDGAQGMYLDGRAFAFERCADEADTALRACAEAPAKPCERHGTPYYPVLCCQNCEHEAELEILGLRESARVSLELLQRVRATLMDQNIDGVNVWEHWMDDDGRLHRIADAHLASPLPRAEALAMDNKWWLQHRSTQPQPFTDQEVGEHISEINTPLRAEAPATDVDAILKTLGPWLKHNSQGALCCADACFCGMVKAIYDLRAEALAPPAPQYATDEQFKALTQRVLERHRPSLEKFPASTRPEALDRETTP